MVGQDADHSAGIDAAFARFVRSGDPDALALVFDRVAPRLILIAAHLVDTSADAEDVLQTTFVEAIRNSHRFTPGRPVLPWLTAILARRAANLRRARGHQPVALSGTLEHVVDPAASPAEDMEARDTADRIRSSVEVMPAPFREVLTLHLVNGLRPIEIARALDRPVGTVHAQIHRGLERLRHKLPPGVAIAVAALLGTRSLAAMRVRVISIAKELAPPALTILGTGVIMKKTIAAMTALLAIVLGSMWYVASRVTSMEPIASPVREITGSGSVPRSDTNGEDSTSGSVADNDQPARQRIDPAHATILTGRIVAGETGAPLAGAVARVTGYDNRGRELNPKWIDPDPVKTGPDGRYRLVIVPMDGVGIDFRVEAADRMAVTGGWEPLRQGFTMDHGDVALPIGTRLRTRIVDESEAPVEGFRLQLNTDRRAGRYRCGLSLSGTGGIEKSNPRGEFPQHMLAPGRVTVSEDSDANYRFIGPWTFEIAEGEVDRELVFRVRRVQPARSISGRIVDTDGHPVSGLDIGADVGRGWRVAHSQRGGRFAIGTFTPSRDPMRLGLMRSDRKFEIVEPLEPVPVGTDDLQVVVRRLLPASLTVEVVDMADQPVENYAAVFMPCQHRNGRTMSDGRLIVVPMGRHPGGRIERELRPGSYLLFVNAASSLLAPRLSYEVELVHGKPCRLRIELAEYRRWAVRAVSAQGEPVADVLVRLRQEVGRGHPSSTMPRSLLEFLEHGARGTYTTLVTAEGTTGPDGRVELRSPADIGSAELTVAGPHIVPVTQAVGPHAPKGEVRVLVENAAIVEGQLRPASVALAWGPTAARRKRFALLATGDQELRQRMPKIRLVDIHDDRRRTTAVRVDVDGSFRVSSVSPGDWRVEFVIISGSTSQNVGIGEIRGLLRGQVRHESFDVKSLRPATLKGIVSLDGAPARHAELVLIGRGGPRVRLDRNGRFHMSRIVAREFTPALVIGESPRTFYVLGDSPIRFRTGEEREMLISFTSRSLEVTLRDARGRPVPGRRLSLRTSGEHPWFLRHLAAPHVTDASGSAHFKHVPKRQLDVLLWNEDVPSGIYRLPDAARATALGAFDGRKGQRTNAVGYTLGR